MSEGFGRVPFSFGERGNVTYQAMMEIAQENKQELTVENLVSKEGFLRSLSDISNPFAKRIRQKQKSKRKSLRTVGKMLKSGDRSEKIEAVKQKERRADDYQRRNPELKSKVLAALRDQIGPTATRDQILAKVRDFYNDVSLADEALEYLLETTEGALHQEVQEAKNLLNDLYGREVAAGRNIGDITRRTPGLGAPTSLRDLYRDVTGNPREAPTLFDELSERYSYDDLQKVIKFLLHSLGADLKAKGPSISHGQLHRLIQETRSLQAILGVYRFFSSRMKLVKRLFAQEGLKQPGQLTFQLLAKGFMGLARERYPTADKALALTSKLGVERWLSGKIIVLSQMRDAVREVALNQIYKSVQHRDELYMAILEALEDLEEELEEEEEVEE